MTAEKNTETFIIRLPAQFLQTAASEVVVQARLALDKHIASLTIDFTETTMIDSNAIGALVSLAKECKTRNVMLVLSSLRIEISDLFIDTGLNKVFNIEGEKGLYAAEVDIFERTIDIRLSISTEIMNATCIFHMSGVMNHPLGSRFFKQEFLLAMMQYKRILLDFEELTFFDSLSVSVVLNMNKLLKETGGEMRICAVNYLITDLFHTLNISQIIPVFPTVTDALTDWA